MKPFVSLQFRYHRTVGMTLWTGDQPVERPIPTQTQNKCIHTSMTWVGFEPTISIFERAKTVHALDDTPVTVIGTCIAKVKKKKLLLKKRRKKHFH
jgi:hypothetical protein